MAAAEHRASYERKQQALRASEERKLHALETAEKLKQMEIRAAAALQNAADDRQNLKAQLEKMEMKMQEMKEMQASLVPSMVSSMATHQKLSNIDELPLAYHFLMLFPMLFVQSDVGIFSGVPIMCGSHENLLVAFNAVVLDMFKLFHTSGIKEGDKQPLIEYVENAQMKKLFQQTQGTKSKACQQLIDELTTLKLLTKLEDTPVDSQKMAHQLLDWGLHGVNWNRCFPLDAKCEDHKDDMFHVREKKECDCTYQDAKKAYVHVLRIDEELIRSMNVCKTKNLISKEFLLRVLARKMQWVNQTYGEMNPYFRPDNCEIEDAKRWSSLAPPLMNHIELGSVNGRTSRQSTEVSLRALISHREIDFGSFGSKKEFIVGHGVFGKNAHPCSAHTRPGYHIPKGVCDIELQQHNPNTVLGVVLNNIVAKFVKVWNVYTFALPNENENAEPTFAWQFTDSDRKRPKEITGCVAILDLMKSWVDIVKIISPKKKKGGAIDESRHKKKASIPKKAKKEDEDDLIDIGTPILKRKKREQIPKKNKKKGRTQ